MRYRVSDRRTLTTIIVDADHELGAAQAVRTYRTRYRPALAPAALPDGDAAADVPG